MKIQGMLAIDELRAKVSSGEIETVLTVFTDLYGRLVGKRFAGDFFLDSVAQHGTHACDYLLTVDMEMEPVAGYEFSNWEKGYGDFHLVPDWETLRSADWLDRTAIVLCNVCNDDEDHTLVDVAPRSLLLNQLAEVRTLGFDVLCASELEYFMFQESYQEAAENSHQKLRQRGWYIEDYHALQGARVEDYNAAIRRHLTRSGVPVESTKGEWGLGQHEINVRYAEAVAMADRHCLIKQCLKEQAETAGMSVTFMAKYSTDQAGNSCHIHMSLARDGENAFHDEATFRHFAGGWLQRIPEFMVFLAPNANSYKRYQAESWAPTRLAWSRDNRTAGIRIVGAGPSLRLECRVPGADCNPYLAYTALLACGIDGIRRAVEPPPIFSGDVYVQDELPHVPRTLSEAINLFAGSDFVKTTLGQKVAEHYLHFFRVENEAYERAVTDWERQRYFERI